MTADPSIITEAEDLVRRLAVELTQVRPGECLCCYVWRQLDEYQLDNPEKMVTLMTMSEFSSVADAKAHLSELVSRVGSQHDRVTVTVHGRPTAVLLAVDDLEALEETISILSDADTVRALAAADSELARGQGETEDALRKAMRARRAAG